LFFFAVPLFCLYFFRSSVIAVPSSLCLSFFFFATLFFFFCVLPFFHFPPNQDFYQRFFLLFCEIASPVLLFWGFDRRVGYLKQSTHKFWFVPEVECWGLAPPPPTPQEVCLGVLVILLFFQIVNFPVFFFFSLILCMLFSFLLLRSCIHGSFKSKDVICSWEKGGSGLPCFFFAPPPGRGFVLTPRCPLHAGVCFSFLGRGVFTIYLRD